MKCLMNAVRQSLKDAGLWRADARLLCALSGGCDSTALLHALNRLEMPFAVSAVHVQHGLRAEESLRDEQFVRALCDTLHIPLYVENAGLSGSMLDPGIETLARERRRDIFERLMREEQMDALLLAHHRDDQTETVLMHLLRGAGGAGLAGMQETVPFGPGMAVRPLLGLSKQEIRNALEAEGLAWCEDGSNVLAVTPRNFLRLETLPALENWFPGAGEHVAWAAESLAEDEKWLQQQAAQLYQQAAYLRPPLFALKRRVLKDAPGALLRRMLRRWYGEALACAGLAPRERMLSHADTISMVQLVYAPEGASLNLPCGLRAEAQSGWLHLLCQSGEPLRPADGYHADIAQRLAQSIPDTPRKAVLTPRIQAMQPVLRTPLPGDVICPLGAPGSKPLRRFLTDRRMDPHFRPVIPVLAAGREVLWVPGVASSELLRISAVEAGSVELSLEGDCAFLENGRSQHHGK